jgi:hypothetical protein
LKLIIYLILSVLVIFSCRKESFTDDPNDKLEFSIDTLTFDTVFSSVGSTTKFFKIINKHPQKIIISDIQLAGGKSSQFRLNIDGEPTYETSSIEVSAKDSIYIFVEVTIDPNSSESPFIIKDSVEFITNGNAQKVILVAWGQNANFYNGEVICDTTWTNNKPHVVYNSVLIDENCSLTIEKGSQIHFHNGSRLYVLGSLIVNGSIDEPVVFQGDRLETFYQDKSGQWEGLHFLRGSISNKINNSVIKNSIIGVRVDSLPENSDTGLVLRNTTIQNTLSSGIIGITGNIAAFNCLVFNCGQYNVQLEYGGIYEFEHCTFTNYSSYLVNHKDPILRLSNYYESDNTLYVSDYFESAFKNCIIYGGMEDEIEKDFYNPGTIDTIYTFEHCNIKTKVYATDTSFKNSIINTSPLFSDISSNNYELMGSSPCIDAGSTSSLTTDIKGNMRPVGASNDIGCYEFQ